MTTIETLSALANIATAAAVVVGAWQLVLAHRLSVTNFEDTFAKEYRDLAARLPTKALLGEPLSDDEHTKHFDENASEQELSRLSRQIQERVMSRSQKACGYITPGMNQSEVMSLLGAPDGQANGIATNFFDTWAYGSSIVQFAKQKVVSGVSGCR